MATPTLKELTDAALALAPEARAQLADVLIESLDQETLGRIDELWLTEATRRLEDIRTGRVETIPGEAALQRVRDAIDR